MDGVKTPTVSLVQSTQTNEITYCSKGNFFQLYYKFPRKFVSTKAGRTNARTGWTFVPPVIQLKYALPNRPIYTRLIDTWMPIVKASKHSGHFYWIKS